MGRLANPSTIPKEGGFRLAKAMVTTMKKEVFISIRGIQCIDGEKDVTELYTQGTLYRQNGSYYLSYDESEATGCEGCKVTLKVEGDRRVTLIRSGAARSHLVMERGGRNIGHYGVEGGTLILGVNTRQIDSQLDDNGGDLYLSYSLDADSSLISENEVFIHVKDEQQAEL